jgi:hypothetical protein
MSAPASWIPLRWPSAWTDPALLSLIQGTPFNCLVLEWSDAHAPVAAKARAMDLPLVAGGNEAARSAGVAAGLGVLPMAQQSKLPWTSNEAVLVATDCVWPNIASQSNGAELSGPTANPWIDSNGWFLRLAKARVPEKTVWLAFDPPAPPRMVVLDAYLRAIADTGTWGGRWVVTLDSDLRGGLARGDAKALESWKAISGAVAFFEKHRQWNSLGPMGVVGVISDFAGANEVRSGEVLNLLGRRSLAYRVVEKSKTDSSFPTGLRALIYIDEGVPTPALRRKLLAFVQQGGLLLVAPSWGQTDGTPAELDHPRVNVRRLGKGRVGVTKDDSPDPFMVARDVHMLLGRSYDVARFFNLSAFLSYCSGSSDGAQELVQIVSFANRANDVATAWVPGKYAGARLWSLGSAGPEVIEMVPENGGTSLPLPAVAVYAGVELSGKRR